MQAYLVKFFNKFCFFSVIDHFISFLFQYHGIHIVPNFVPNTSKIYLKKTCDSGCTQYLRLDCVKMSHSEAIVMKKFVAINQYFL